MLNKDVKDYLLYSSSKLFDILKLSSRMFVIPSVVVYPTNMCNYKCNMCLCSAEINHDKQLIKFSTIKKIINECSSYLIKPRIHFSGYGEPLVYPKIKETMKLCKEKKMKWSMTTNGFLLEKYAKDIIESDCDAINISIHGKELEHERITKIKGSFDKTLKGIKKIEKLKKNHKKKRPLMAINCVFNNENIPKLKDILNNLSKLPVNSVTFQHLTFTKNDMKNKNSFVIKNKNKLNQLIEFVKYVENNKLPIKVNFFPKIKTKDLIDYYTNENKEFKNSCVIHWLNARIFPNGDVKTFCNYKLGNVKKDKIKKIMNNKKARDFRKMVKKKGFMSNMCFRCCHRHYY
jgi:MoaA/NifB/PqqE/SkfB family radical SAM enzyme